MILTHDLREGEVPDKKAQVKATNTAKKEKLMTKRHRTTIPHEIAQACGISVEDATRVYQGLDPENWGGDVPYACGVIDDDSNPNKIAGHAGFWACFDGTKGAFVYFTNSDPVWGESNCEDDVTESGIATWDDIEDYIEAHKICYQESFSSVLYADTTNGVLSHGDDQYVTNTVNEETFFDSLKTLPDEEYIKCENISQTMYDKIQKVYAIH